MPPFGPETRVREVLFVAPQAIEVLERHRLDYCCGAGRTVMEACEKAGADLATVLAALDDAARRPRSNSEQPLPPETLDVRAQSTRNIVKHRKHHREIYANLLANLHKKADFE